MHSDLQGRLRNTQLPHKKGLMPVYEAVVNSIESIEEKHEISQRPLNEYSITVKVIRREPQALEETVEHLPPIYKFEIVDDGVGFTDNNWESFNTLDSGQKLEKGCRGIGRLMWLKAFDNVYVDSNYKQDGDTRRRCFTFNTKNEVTSSNFKTVASSQIRTMVVLEGFKEPYVRATHKTLEKISNGLLEHCLWYFIRSEGVPTIKVVDGEESVELFDLFDAHMHSSASSESVSLKGKRFEITHVKIRTTQNKAHLLGYCASGRLVKTEKLSDKIPGLYKAISDSTGQFHYMAYLTGEYLDERVTNERIDFNISDKNDGLFGDSEISFRDIKQMVFPTVRNFLGDSLTEVLEEGTKRVDKFVSEKKPRYRPLLQHIPKDRLLVDPNISDQDLDVLLHRETFEVEENILKEGHHILNGISDYDSYSEQLQQYLRKVTDLKQSDLASYVAHRKLVIDLLECAIVKQSDGKFIKENVIHELIVPMRVTSSDSEYHRQNLWLIDERLTFHHFLSSDKPISTNPTTKSTSTKRPDISSLRIWSNPMAFREHKEQASITVIELKQPMRKSFVAGSSEDDDPILQSLGYLRRLREGATTIDGRLIPNVDTIPGYIYVLADLTEPLINCCRLLQLRKTADGMGYFGYHADDAYKAYIQVISFDGLIASVKERHRAFFDTLGLPT